MLTEVEKRVLAAIDMDGLLTYLSALVSLKTLSNAETVGQRHIAARMASSGMDVDLWDIDFDALKRHPAYTAEVDRSEGLGVVGILPGTGGGRDLILNGHMDVVPEGDPRNWRYPPWQGTVAEGRVYGRGAVDMKGGLCCGLFAAKAIHDAGVRLKGRLLVESVIGEEDGGGGALATILRGHTADGAVIMEPTEMAIITAQAGTINFRVTVPGLSAHGAMRREGVSAIEKFIVLHEALMALEARRNAHVEHPLLQQHDLPYPLSIGVLRAGNWPSSVPEELVFEGRYGVAVGEDMDEACAAFETALAGAARQDPWLSSHPPRVEWYGGLFESASIDQAHPLVTMLGEAHTAACGRPAPLAGVTYGSDMRLFIRNGNIPAVLFGPGDVRRAHQPDEFVPISDLEAVTQTLALLALRFCGVASDWPQQHLTAAAPESAPGPQAH